MASSAVQQRPAVRRVNPVWDRIFFSGMIALLWATVLFGFARTYFMAGMFRAPLPDRLIHVHGAVFTSWMVLLLIQELLVAGRKIQWHRTLGLAGFGLAVAMVVLGVLAATDALRRGADGGSGLGALTFYAVPMTGIATFAVLVWFAYRARRQPAAHKRLILIATIAIAEAAVARWPIAALQADPPMRNWVMLAFLLLVAGYDLLSLRRVQKATLWGSVLVMVIMLGQVPLGMTPWWHAFAAVMRGKG